MDPVIEPELRPDDEVYTQFHRRDVRLDDAGHRAFVSDGDGPVTKLGGP